MAIFQNEKQEPSHPADTLGVALARAGGVLGALTTCHDPVRGNFAVGDQFVLQAIVAIEGFITDARNAYVDVCNRCDLRLVDQAPVSEGTGAPASHTPNGSAAVVEGSMEGTELPPLPREDDAEHHSEPSPAARDYALTYDELLRKVTAAEIFVSTENGDNKIAGSDFFLPILKSLRQDIERLRAA